MSRKFPYIQSTEPTEAEVGDIWVDTGESPPVMKQCESVDPVTFVASNAGSNGATLTVAETEVFSGTSPTSWTDLNLSGVVGANAALVILKEFGSGYGQPCGFRRNGDTDDASLGQALNWKVHIVPTDANGIVEWKTGSAVAGWTVDVIAYIKWG